MKQKEKTQIIQKIKSEILDTEKKIKKYKELSKPIAPENAIGRVSRMDAINNKSVVEAALRESLKKLENLKIVKGQINKSDFGILGLDLSRRMVNDGLGLDDHQRLSRLVAQ